MVATMSEVTTRLVNARLRGAVDGNNQVFRHPSGMLATVQAVYLTDAQERRRLNDVSITGGVVTLAAAPVPGVIIDADAQVRVPSSANLLPPNATHAWLVPYVHVRQHYMGILPSKDAGRCHARSEWNG